MRPFRTAVLILGLFTPLVIQAQPFGDTEMAVFDTEFLSAPPGPDPLPPPEPPVPAWVVESPGPEVWDGALTLIPLPEIPS